MAVADTDPGYEHKPGERFQYGNGYGSAHRTGTVTGYFISGRGILYWMMVWDGSTAGEGPGVLRTGDLHKENMTWI